MREDTEPGLSHGEREALRWLRSRGGSMLISHVPDKNEKDEFGFTAPGMTVFRKLEKKGAVVITEEEGDLTPVIEFREGWE